MNLIAILCTTLAVSFNQPEVKNQSKSIINASEIVCKTPEIVWKTEYRDTKILIESSVVVHKVASTNTNQERVVFRYTNLTGKKIKVSFARKMYYNGICYGCDNNKLDKNYSVDLNAAQIKEFSAENKDKTFYIFSKDLNGSIKKTLDNYELINIETIVQ